MLPYSIPSPISVTLVKTKLGPSLPGTCCHTEYPALLVSHYLRQNWVPLSLSLVAIQHTQSYWCHTIFDKTGSLSPWHLLPHCIPWPTGVTLLFLSDHVEDDCYSYQVSSVFKNSIYIYMYYSPFRQRNFLT